MPEQEPDRPSAELERRQVLEALQESPDAALVLEAIEHLQPSELARAVATLPSAEQGRLFELAEPDRAAAIFTQLPEVQAAALIEELQPDHAATILEQLPHHEQAGLLSEIDVRGVEQILSHMETESAVAVRRLYDYPDETAGALMVQDVLRYEAGSTVGAVAADLQRHADAYRDLEVQYLHVIDEGGRLRGGLPLRDLLLSPLETAVAEAMLPDLISVPVSATVDELEDLFTRHSFFGLPVVDDAGRLLGVVQRSDLEHAFTERSEDEYRKSLGIVGGEELRSFPYLLRSRRRLSWLSLNVVLNIAAASVIALYQDTLAAVISLAAFLPIISDMSGCSGNQAVAVSMRELSLGLATPRDAFSVWRKESSLALLNGSVLGLLLGAAAWLWQGNLFLSLVVGLALAANTVVAVSIGGVVPLVLRGLDLDPALASGPILTTVTDLCGFLMALSLATLWLPRLVG